MNTKRSLEIVLSFFIGWMIYSMLFMREGHLQLGMSSISAGGVGEWATEENNKNQKADKADRAARVATDRGLLPQGWSRQ